MNHGSSRVVGSCWLTPVQCECHGQLCDAGLRLCPSAEDGATCSVLHNSHPLDVEITAHPGSFLPGHIKRTAHTCSHLTVHLGQGSGHAKQDKLCCGAHLPQL